MSGNIDWPFSWVFLLNFSSSSPLSSSNKVEEEVEEEGLSNRKRKATSVYDLLADSNGIKGGMEEDCELYVTKLQGEVRQFNQCNMFHEYAWN